MCIKNEFNERWGDIPGFEGYYQVSTIGRVKSIPRKIPNNGGFFISKEKLMSIGKRDGKYPSVTFTKNSIAYFFRVHVLMGIAFLDYDTSDKITVIDHINNISTDNRLENLQVISQRDNIFKDQKSKKYSKLIGVSFSITLKKWRARITIGGKEMHLGYYNLEKDASNQYQKAIDKIDFYVNPKQFRKFLCENIS